MEGRIVRQPAAWDRKDSVLLAAAVVLGALVRVIYVLRLELSPYDPWRHLLLIDNLRSGAGFTLFDGQPYIWYQPPWYLLCALFPEALGPDWIAALLSLLCVPLAYLWARAGFHAGPAGAGAAAVLMAGLGPVVRYTCHLGPEALSLFLTLGALTLAARREEVPSTVAAGVMFGLALVCRVNFAFAAPLFLPVCRTGRRATALAAGTALPLLLAWWRNHRIIGAYDYLFTWDGLATPAERFNALSTLLIQLHPDVREGLHRLHQMIAPVPEWTANVWMLALVALAVLCLAGARRVAPLLAFGSGFLYFVFLDGSGSARFFRIWLALFPAMILAMALVTEDLGGTNRWGRLAGAALIAVVLLAGLPLLSPPRMPPLEAVTPPPGLLDEDRYLVNSTFYHPESLIYRYRDKQFIGLPLDPADFAEFRRAHPAFDTVLWHDISVQQPLRRHLVESAGYRVTQRAVNEWGRVYVVLRPAEDGGR
jgi:hypothetical protein